MLFMIPLDYLFKLNQYWAVKYLHGLFSNMRRRLTFCHNLSGRSRNGTRGCKLWLRTKRALSDNRFATNTTTLSGFLFYKIAIGMRC